MSVLWEPPPLLAVLLIVACAVAAYAVAWKWPAQRAITPGPVVDEADEVWGTPDPMVLRRERPAPAPADFEPEPATALAVSFAPELGVLAPKTSEKSAPLPASAPPPSEAPAADSLEATLDISLADIFLGWVGEGAARPTAPPEPEASGRPAEAGAASEARPPRRRRPRRIVRTGGNPPGEDTGATSA